MLIAVLNVEFHLRSFRAANPVALSLLYGVAPVDGVKTIEEPLGISRHAQAPLLHAALNDRESAADADAVDNLVVGQHRAETGTPVDHCLAEISYAVVHQRALLRSVVHGFPIVGGERKLLTLSHIEALGARLLKVADKFGDRTSLLTLVAIERVEHLLEGPLGPMIITWITGTYLTVPVEGEPNLVELLTVVGYILVGGLLRVLTGLDGILLGRQSVGIVAHRVENVETLQPLVARIDVGGNIAKGMTHVEPGTGRVGEHVQNIVLLLSRVLDNLVCSVVDPRLLPLLLNFSEVVIHCYYLDFILSFILIKVQLPNLLCKDTPIARDNKIKTKVIVDKPVDNVWKTCGKRVDKALGYPHNAPCHFR